MTSRPRNFTLTKPDGTLKTAQELQEDASRLVADARERGERMRAQLVDNVVEATSQNQAATVTVTASGAMQSVRLSDRVKGMGPAKIAASVMEAYQDATRQAAARTAEITEQEVGDERVTSLMRELLPDFAKPEAEEGR